ncbi:E3 ubiquitin-protein ligase TRIM35-like [Genypterus blacodes]|uniref:E3 ubiquitin-protein ligase TRIM35-like n=1 Tax=Genypterus blacodes TaxID=154954 RepID=UPI003F758647
MIQHSQKQRMFTEKQIRAQFKQLQQLFKEEEESRLAALREEEVQKGKTMVKDLIEEKLSSLSDCIYAVEEELLKQSTSFLRTYKATRSRNKSQYSQSEQQLLSGALVDVAKHLGNLSFRVWDKMKDNITFTPVILDPNTAGRCFYLSDDLTSVRHGDTRQQLPANPERNITCPFVLGSEGFSSGKHSWEVEVGDLPDWTVGLVNESIDRTGVEIDDAPKYGFWCFQYCNGNYNDGFGEAVRVEKSLQRIRVQLDYDEGEVSFYDPEDKIHIYTHQNSFTEKLFPYFSVGEAADAKREELKICQTAISL